VFLIKNSVSVTYGIVGAIGIQWFVIGDGWYAVALWGFVVSATGLMCWAAKIAASDNPPRIMQFTKPTKVTEPPDVP
jgi:hypothetical protein